MKFGGPIHLVLKCGIGYMLRMKMEHGKTFCILPWIHAATLTDGSVQLCCVSKDDSGINLNHNTLEDYWNSNYLKDVRQKMMHNEPVYACSRCYEEEANGYRSHRIVENEVWFKKLGEETFNSIVANTEFDGSITGSPLSIDLRLGNTCNLQCVMCQPRESSMWLNNARKLSASLKNRDLASEWEWKSKIEVEKFEWYKNDNFWTNLETFLPYMREIIVAGGEPMLIKEHARFIKRCALSGESSHIQLRYHTNGTIIPEDLIDSWEKFESVEMFVSVDGFGDIANYVRYPTDWKVVEQNLKKYDDMKPNIKLKLLYTIHALNAHHTLDFLQWVKNSNFRKMKDYRSIEGFVHPGLVHYPRYLNIKVLPADLKKEIADRFSRIQDLFPGHNIGKYTGAINFMNSANDSEQISALLEYVAELDTLRHTSFDKTFENIVRYFK